ncbi:hypothetical protein F5878DRAFT_646706 [Lentinula raphanica]|uniref:Uncharacterized protein n=1 Tax=Lentinula raphanica TaxID=153919 RepID=A0AA38NXV4_9AGAR|nr:hypothetical protein F5878DRAFT_646706 [Lentinula raphanica]
MHVLVLRVLRYETSGKGTTGAYKVQIDDENLEFSISETRGKGGSGPSALRTLAAFTGYTVISNEYQSALKWNEVPEWVKTALTEKGLQKPDNIVALTRVDKFIADIEAKQVRPRYLDGWKMERVKELMLNVKRQEVIDSARESKRERKAQAKTENPGPLTSVLADLANGFHNFSQYCRTSFNSRLSIAIFISDYLCAMEASFN